MHKRIGRAVWALDHHRTATDESSARVRALPMLGVADHLVAGPAAAEVLAGHTGAHAPSLRRLLRTLVSVGVFTGTEPGVSP